MDSICVRVHMDDKTSHAHASAFTPPRQSKKLSVEYNYTVLLQGRLGQSKKVTNWVHVNGGE